MNDWNHFFSLFSFTLAPAEILIRGTAMYWFLFLLFRFVIRRDVGAIAIADVLLLVIIADASQNAMAGEYTSITDGCLLVVTIAGWNYLLDWSSYRFPAVRRLVEAKPLRLIHNGRVLRANMRREFITIDELESKMREQGVSRFAEVREAFLENDGEISLLLAEKKGEEWTGDDDVQKELPAILKPGHSEATVEKAVETHPSSRSRHPAL